MSDTVQKNKYRVLALYGKSGCGKDTVKDYLLKTNKNMVAVVPYTTRPPRDEEKDGVDYHFVSKGKFTDMILCGNCFSVQQFNHWFYGLAEQSFVPDKINIGVFNPKMISDLLCDDNFDVLPVLIHAEDKVRLTRSLNREKDPDCHEICRRFMADEIDFQDISSIFGDTYYDNNSEFCGYFNILKIPAVAAWLDKNK